MPRAVLLLTVACVVGLAADDTGRIRGVVTDVTGASVPGARVRLLAMDTRRTLIATVSSQSGEIAIDKLAAGAYRLAVSASGFRAKSVDLTVQAGAETQAGKVKLEIVSCDYPGVICDYIIPVGGEWPKDNRHSHGDLTLRLGCGADVDKGAAYCTPNWQEDDRTADFLLTLTADRRPIFEPRNGAKLVEPNSTGASCRGEVFVDRPVRVDGLSIGSDLCLRTSEGRLAQIFFTSDVEPDSKEIAIQWVTWK